jgi:hypothetical protein
MNKGLDDTTTTETKTWEQKDSTVFPPLKYSDFRVKIRTGKVQTTLHLSKHMVERWNSPVMNEWITADEVCLENEDYPAARFETFFTLLNRGPPFDAGKPDDTVVWFILAHKFDTATLQRAMLDVLCKSPSPAGIEALFLRGFPNEALKLIKGIRVLGSFGHYSNSPFKDRANLEYYMKYFISHNNTTLALELTKHILYAEGSE